MKVKHPKLMVSCGVLIALVLAVLFLPVIPFSSPGTMGGGGLSSAMDHILPPYPANQPDSLPVYRVTDYVNIQDDTKIKYDYGKDPYSQSDVREWMTNILKDEFDLPLPEGKTEPEFYDETEILRGFHIHPKVDGMKLHPSRVWISADDISRGHRNSDTSIGYRGYKLENVGEIKIISAQEAHKLLNDGHDISMISRFRGDHKFGEQCWNWTGVPITDISLQWYYPTTAENKWQFNGEYLIPIWYFRNPDSYAAINAVDGDLRAEWSPEGNPNFTPNNKFYELKDIKTKKWIKDPTFPGTNVERGVDIHA